jgi:hypothetical protein
MSRKTSVIAILLASAVLLILAIGRLSGPMSAALADLTGEKRLLEQIKGLGALVLIRLERHAPDVEPYVPIAHVGLNPYGINTFLEQEVEDWKIDRSLQLISEAGFKWIRQEFPWEDIEIEGKGIFVDHREGGEVSSWKKYDHIVDLAEEYGIELIVRLDNPPAWSRAAGNEGGTLAPPDDFADYGDFVYAVVSRYKGRINYYQIWNEPNIYPEWGEAAVDPEAYTELLKVGYTRAKEADPDVVILSAGLAPTTEVSERNLMDLVFLQRMYDAGAADYFDILSVQGYGLWNGPTDRRIEADRANFGRVMLIRELMVQNGDAHKPIWASEVGWNALPKEFDGFPYYGRVSEELQADYTAAAYRLAQEEWPWMGVMSYWFFRRPSDHENNQAFYYFRMMEPEFYAYPVYYAMKEQATSPPILGLGYHQEDHWALTYEGSWEDVDDDQAVLGGYRLSDQAGDGLSFTFWGTDLSLVPVCEASPASLEVTIDGRSTRLEVCTSGASYGEEVPLVRSLAEGQHAVQLTVGDADAGTGRVAIDGLIVRRTPLFLIQRGLVLLALAALALVIVLVVRRQRMPRGSPC